MMKSQVDPKLVLVAIVLIVAVLGFAFYKLLAPRKNPTDEKGIPLVPTESQAGADAMAKIFKGGIMPPKTR
jgi:hypothetical protein